jgi:mono/diheme cytochrome c family protein
LDLRTLIIVLNVAALLFFAAAATAALRQRRRRAVRALNLEEYYDDPALEGRRLTHTLGWALGLVAVLALSLPAYWLIEPTRQDEMEDQFLETSIERGSELFAPTSPGNLVALGCANCHGPEGEGGVAIQSVNIDKDELVVAAGALNDPDRTCAPVEDDPDSLLCEVTWEAPSLNDVFYRFSREEIVQIITYGRPGTPMPAWGVAGGGPKNGQSIDNIVDFLESLQVSPDKARAEHADLRDGQQLFEANCARCHTKHWSYRNAFARRDDVGLRIVPGGGAFGPNLTGGVTERQFPAVDDQVEFVRTGSDANLPYGTRGIGSGRMPGFRRILTDEQVRAIVEYERSLEPVEAAE